MQIVTFPQGYWNNMMDDSMKDYNGQTTQNDIVYVSDSSQIEIIRAGAVNE